MDLGERGGRGQDWEDWREGKLQSSCNVGEKNKLNIKERVRFYWVCNKTLWF